MAALLPGSLQEYIKAKTPFPFGLEDSLARAVLGSFEEPSPTTSHVVPPTMSSNCLSIFFVYVLFSFKGNSFHNWTYVRMFSWGQNANGRHPHLQSNGIASRRV